VKQITVAAVISALALGALTLVPCDAFASKIVEIAGKYSKIKLDGICSANGGASYGSATTGYGCTKGSNTVECDKSGSCKGYVSEKAARRNVGIGDVLGTKPAASRRYIGETEKN
jgi:hypothetical protein